MRRALLLLPLTLLACDVPPSTTRVPPTPTPVPTTPPVHIVCPKPEHVDGGLPPGYAVVGGKPYRAIWHNFGNNGEDGGPQDLDFVMVILGTYAPTTCNLLAPADGGNDDGWEIALSRSANPRGAPNQALPLTTFQVVGGGSTGGGLVASVSTSSYGEGASGSVTLDALDCVHAEGSLEVDFPTGEHVKGRFNAPSCP